MLGGINVLAVYRRHGELLSAVLSSGNIIAEPLCGPSLKPRAEQVIELLH